MAKQNETKLMQVVIFVEGDTDVFEVRNPLIVNWDALRKTVKIKQSFYMSRVRRKENPKTYSRIPRKSYLNSENLKTRQIRGVEQVSSTPNFEQLS